MYQDEYQHMQNDYQYWYGNLQDKWKQQEIAAQKYAADSAMRVQQFLQQNKTNAAAAAAAQAKAEREAQERAAGGSKSQFKCQKHIRNRIQGGKLWRLVVHGRYFWRCP